MSEPHTLLLSAQAKDTNIYYPNLNNQQLSISGFANDSVVDGVGLRFTVFVQGCLLKCFGCHNANTQPFSDKTIYNINDIIKMIDNNPLIDGVTFSGGEPMCQAQTLAKLAKQIKERNLHLCVYTGFVYERLFAKNAPAGVQELLQYTDILIDGPFVMQKRDIYLKFRGSSNQRIIDVQKSLLHKQTILCDNENWN